MASPLRSVRTAASRPAPGQDSLVRAFRLRVLSALVCVQGVATVIAVVAQGLHTSRSGWIEAAGVVLVLAGAGAAALGARPGGRALAIALGADACAVGGVAYLLGPVSAAPLAVAFAAAVALTLPFLHGLAAVALAGGAISGALFAGRAIAHAGDWALGGGILAAATLLASASRNRLSRLLHERTHAVARAREMHAVLDSLFENAPLSLAYVDRRLRFVRVNDAFVEALGLPRSEVIGKGPREVVPRLGPAIEGQLRDVVLTGVPVVGEALTLAGADDREDTHWVVSRVPVRAPDGEILGVVSIGAEVTGLRQAETRLQTLLDRERDARARIEAARLELVHQHESVERAASTDDLTGLTNRRHVTEQAVLAVARAELAGAAVAALYVDLDGFKAVNDTLGHAAGDELLRVAASRLRAAARETDVVARLGGDEFLVLLADLPVAAAAEIAAVVAGRIQHAFAGAVETAHGEARLAASIGIGVFPHHAADAGSLVRAADSAMYTAKTADGRIAHAAPPQRSAA